MGQNFSITQSRACINEPHLPLKKGMSRCSLIPRPGGESGNETSLDTHPLCRMHTYTNTCTHITCGVVFTPHPSSPSRLPKESAIDVHSARVASMFLQPPPHPVLWLGLQSGHLLLINAVSRAPIMVTKRHVTSIRCIQSVKALGKSHINALTLAAHSYALLHDIVFSIIIILWT